MSIKINKKSLKIFSLFLVIALISSISSCDEKIQHDTIPYVPFYAQIDVNSTEYIDLNTIGGWVYLTGGYKGILVYRISNEQFVAFERACPYDPTHNESRISMDKNNITCSCNICESEFIILDGSVSKGPSTLPLMALYTYYDGYTLRINN